MASILDLAAVISEHTGMDKRIAWLQGKGVVHIYYSLSQGFTGSFSAGAKSSAEFICRHYTMH